MKTYTDFTNPTNALIINPADIEIIVHNKGIPGTYFEFINFEDVCKSLVKKKLDPKFTLRVDISAGRNEMFFDYGPLNAPSAPNDTKLDQLNKKRPLHIKVRVIDKNKIWYAAYTQRKCSYHDASGLDRKGLIKFEASDSLKFPYTLVVTEDPIESPTIMINSAIYQKLISDLEDGNSIHGGSSRGIMKHFIIWESLVTVISFLITVPNDDYGSWQDKFYTWMRENDQDVEGFKEHDEDLDEASRRKIALEMVDEIAKKANVIADLSDSLEDNYS